MWDLFEQVYTLEKVLKMKRDITTQVMFLDEAMKVRYLSLIFTLPRSSGFMIAVNAKCQDD